MSPAAPFGNYQYEIYLAGLAGRVPELPIGWSQLEAAAEGVGLIASTASSFTLEQIADAGPGAPRWFQLYWPRDQELATSFIRRAEAAGYRALVVTLDTWLLAWRPRDLQG